jgi:hypothetical protein
MKRGLRGALRAGIWVLTCALLSAALPLTVSAEVIKLRRIVTDEEGNFTVLFSLLSQSGGDPISDPAQVPLANLSMSAGDSPAELQAMELDEPSLTLLREYGAPIRVVIMLPNTAQFNGVPDDASYPDQWGLRSALRGALQTLPERTDITIQVGFYNDEVEWLPEFNTTQLANLSAQLESQDYAAVGTSAYFENPFGAIDVAYRNKLRRQSRQGPRNDFVHFFILVTSGSPQVDEGGELGVAAQGARTQLTGTDVSDVVTMTVVYAPDTSRQILMNPSGEPVRFAEGVTPESGSYRITGSAAGIREAMQQTIDEINSSFILRFNNTDLETDRNLQFRMALAQEGASVESNLLETSVQERAFNLWGLILTVGLILIGTVLLLILVIYLIKRPKKEPEAAPVVVEQQVSLCIQCGRALRDDLQYCHHCAAEPNYGLIKILEGPEAGWTYFLRDVATEVGTVVGNSIRLRDPGISGNHMRITVQEGRRYLIEDLKSSNGTYIEGARVDKQYLKNGDVIVMGSSTKLKFTIS